MVFAQLKTGNIDEEMVTGRGPLRRWRCALDCSAI